MKIYDEHKNHHDLHNQIILSAHVAAIAMFILCAGEQTTLICQELLMCTNKDTNINTQQCTVTYIFLGYILWFLLQNLHSIKRKKIGLVRL